MSVIGISPSDVAKLVQLTLWLYDHCFNQLNTAHAKYIQFGQQIQGLTTTLRALLEQSQWQQQTLNAYIGSFTSYQEGARRDFAEAVGNYEATLADCRALLTSESAVKVESGFVKNVVWGVAIQNKVDALTTRVRDHNDRIRLLLEPVRGDQLQRMEAMLFGVWEIVNPAPELQLSLIPDSIIDRIESTLQTTLNELGTTFAQLPRKTKYDALHKVWHESTMQVSKDADQTIEQHINLLKTAYFIRRLKNEAAYNDARPGFPYRRTILEIQKATVRQMNREDLKTFSEDSLNQLDPASFHIIPLDSPEDPMAPVDENPWEEKILEVSLPAIRGCSSHTMMVYRNGPETLRIVRERVASKTNAVSRDRESLSTMSDLLIPFYAQGPRAGFNLKARSRTGAGTTSYEFDSRADALAFQRAVTGYRVNGHFDKVNVSFHRPGVHMSTLPPMRCTVQIWRWLPLQPLQKEKARNVSVSSDNNTSTVGSSFQSQFATSTFTNVTDGLHPSIIDSSMVSVLNTGEGQGGVIAAETLPPPLLVIYTRSGGALLFFATALLPSLRKSDTSCDCSSKPEKCVRSMLKSTAGSFELRKFSTDTSPVNGDALDKWDLSVFSRSSNNPSKQHPDFNSKVVPAIEAKWLSLDFEEVAQRKRFDTDLRATAILRDREQKKLEEFYKHVKFLASRPREAAVGAGTSPTSPSMRQNPSETTIKPTRTNPPTADPKPRRTTDTRVRGDATTMNRPASGNTFGSIGTLPSLSSTASTTPEAWAEAESVPPLPARSAARAVDTSIPPEFVLEEMTRPPDANIRKVSLQSPHGDHLYCNCGHANQEPTPLTTPTHSEHAPSLNTPDFGRPVFEHWPAPA